MTGRILIIDRTASSREQYSARLAGAFYTPLPAEDDEAALSFLRTGTAGPCSASGHGTASGMAPRPDAGPAPELALVILSPACREPASVIAALRAVPAGRSLPIVALVPGDDPALRIAALAAGADEALPHPLGKDLLLARIRSLMRLRAESTLVASALGAGAGDGALLALAESAAEFEVPPRIALVAARPETALGWTRFVRSQLRSRMAILWPGAVLDPPDPADGPAPDIMMIEAGIDGGSGIRLMLRLAERGTFRHCAFCIVTEDGDSATAAAAFGFGAHGVISRGRMEGELDLRLQALLRQKRQKDRLRHMMERELLFAVTDPLTGVHNRRYAQPHLAGIARRAAEDGTHFAVMVIDLDRFKSVNDRYGHAAGDAVLIEVARRLTGNLRVTDLLARIGGEEFLVALPRANLDEAHEVAERLRSAISDTPIMLPSGEQVRVTASIGVAVGGDTSRADCRILMEHADRALLSAKLGGRNLVNFSACAA